MKTLAWIVTSAAVAVLAYTMAPDLVRYMKIRSM